ncbi:MSCRAMM family protein [Listeria cornellensis]|uniref:LPXTG-motif containing, cell wall anchor domain protein / collagen-adhesion protein n=1 Tax=Listeria cornellensis FSL F6-0969 TaxID=1265820 RepID=W7C3E7_9LIST|nr:SpaA isopeptide-forming pilin-related protein [Listeria cornellensis]EUJ31607.1 LPXTG-motif containing, cell wall anchor domain protein / collagen-adhesion protein [Listeria cornellensis FSL F6-0969]
MNVSNGGGTAVGTKGQVTLHKVDDAGNKLTGAKFELWNQANTAVLREGLVDANGGIIFGALPYGTYLLKETQAPAGVSVSTELKNGKPIEINATTSAPIAFTNIVNERSTVELSKKAEDNTNLAGATFKLEQKIGTTWTRIRANETFVSNQAGKLVVRGLDEGTYRFTETKAPTVPKSYILNTTPVEFTVTKDGNGVIASQTVGPVVNYLGDISFKKVAEDGTTGLAGAIFKVTRVADGAGAVVNEVITTTLTSVADGSVQLTGLAPGHYTLQETKAPTGYILNTKVQNFVIAASQAGNPDTVILENQVNYKGSVQFMKTNVDHQGLGGAEFEIRKFVGNDLIQTVTSDGTGKVSAPNLAPGIYKLIETKAPDGYILNTANHFFTISAQANGQPQTVNLGDIINYKGSIALTKVNGQGERLAGAEYTLYDDKDAELGVYTSSKAGLIKIDDLSPGDYKLVETKAPLQSNGQSYVLNKYPVEFTINASQNGVVKELNLGQYQNFKGIVKLTKTGGSQALSGAIFDLYKFGEDQPIKQVISDDSGQIDYGDVGPGYYKLIETKAPNGFIINKNPIYFVVSASGGENQVIDRGNFENFQASIEFNKTDEDGKQLTTAVFELIQVSDVDGNQVNQSLTKELKANEEGVYHFDGLAPGKYEVKEVRAPDGYILNTKPQTFEITEAFMDNPGTIKLADFVNYKGSAVLSKVNEQNQGLAGVSFELTNEVTKETAPFKTDEAGKLVMDDLDPGKYTLVETKAKAGYILNTKPVTFTIDRTASGIPKQVALGTFVNYKGRAVLTKVDAGNKAEKLVGTQFKLIDERGKTLKSGLTTDKMGQVNVRDLSPGKYAFVETKASTGYQITDEEYRFTINDKGTGVPKAITVQAENKKISTVDPTSSSNNNGATGNGGSDGKSTFFPETGDSGLMYLLLIGVILLGIGLFILKPNKEGNKH